MEGFQGSEVPPCRGKAILQKLPAALTWGLEQLYVASQPGLKRRQTGEKRSGDSTLLNCPPYKPSGPRGPQQTLTLADTCGPDKKLSNPQACLPVDLVLMSPVPLEILGRNSYFPSWNVPQGYLVPLPNFSFLQL